MYAHTPCISPIPPLDHPHTYASLGGGEGEKRGYLKGNRLVFQKKFQKKILYFSRTNLDIFQFLLIFIYRSCFYNDSNNNMNNKKIYINEESN